MSQATKNWIRDAAERVVCTFLAAFLAAWMTTPVWSGDAAKSAALAGLTAAFTLLKSILAGFVGDPNTAGLTEPK